MLTVCYTAKGGQGCSTVTALLALMPRQQRPATIVDLTGDMPALLGLPDHDVTGAGITDLLTEPDPSRLTHLHRHTLTVTDTVDLAPLGQAPLPPPGSDRWTLLADLLETCPHRRYYVDAGLDSPLTQHAAERYLVTRHCYLALRRARHNRHRPHGVITIYEPCRPITAEDIPRVVDAPVLATLDYTARTARLIDSGLLATRLPDDLRHHPLSNIAASTTPTDQPPSAVATGSGSTM